MPQLEFHSNMLQAAIDSMPARHEGEAWRLMQGDSLDLLRQLPPQCADLVFADPPYNLSNGGTTCRSGERVSVDKGAWDVSGGLQSDHSWHRTWLQLVKRVLKPSGTLWVSGTQHVIFSVGYAMQGLGYHLLNTVTWCKPNASPNLGCRQLTHSTELIVWALPAPADPLPHIFHYDDLRAGNDGKQLRDYWTIPTVPKSEKRHGQHPTQKPLALLDRIVSACSDPDSLVIDPFCGSGTTAVVAIARGRRFIGIDMDPQHLDTSAARIQCTGATCTCREALREPVTI